MKKIFATQIIMRRSLSNATRTLCALLALASLIFSSPLRSAGARLGDSSKRAAAVAASQAVSDGAPVERAAVQKNYGALPLSFEANLGQTDRRVRFLARGDGYRLFLTPQEAVFSLRSPPSVRGDESARDAKTQLKTRSRNSVLRMTLVGSTPSPKISGEGELQGRSHYYSGKDQRRWIRDVPSYAKVRYEQVYAGVDVVYYGKQRELEYDFVVAPGADPGPITLGFKGADEITLDDAGDLVLRLGEQRLTQTAPVIYQEAEGERRAVEGAYVLKGKGRVGFRVGAYDARLPLVIDPVARISFSTFHGGTGDDNARGVAVDSAGNAVVAGFTDSADYPAQNADPDDFAGGVDAFVTKFNATGTGTIYSVYLGGKKDDQADAVAVDPAGNAYVAGLTGSRDFPVTPGVVDESLALHDLLNSTDPQDCFVTKLDTGGNVAYSTFLGGQNNDRALGIAVDAAGRAYVTGETESRNFPVKNAFQSDFGGGYKYNDAFVTVLNSAATGFIYSSYLGGRKEDSAKSIALDSAGNAYVTGNSDSDGTFPVKSPSPSGPFQNFVAGGEGADVFVTKINPFASGEASLVYSTFVGGVNSDVGFAIAVDNLDRAHVTGRTESLDFPLLAAPGAEILDRESSKEEAFVFSVNADGAALVFSTFFGGDAVDAGRGIRVDAAGNTYLAGNTTSATGFPIARAFQPAFGGGELSDGFVAKLAPEGRKILYSSYLGGSRSDVGFAIAVDARGNAYVAGDAVSDDFPITDGVVQRERAGSGDIFLTKIGETNPDTVGVFNPSALQFQLRNANAAGAPDLTIDFGQAGDIPVAGDWDADGVTDVGVFRPAAGQFLLLVGRDVITVTLGQAGDLPVAGDWNGDGIDSVGVFRPSKQQFFLTNTNELVTTIDFSFQFGANGDLPAAGDWDASGTDEVGVFSPGAGQFFLAESVENPVIDTTVIFGIAGDRPTAGDWDGDGVDSVGVFRPSSAQFFLTNTNALSTTIDFNFQFGAKGDSPVAGDWDGRP